MQSLSKSLLCAAVLGLLSGTSAFANVNGVGSSFCGYVGSIKTVVANVPGYSFNYSIHPTYNGCVSGLINIVNTFSNNPNILIVPPTNYCHYVPCMGDPRSADPDPMSPERILGGVQVEQQLRDQYNVEAYEHASQALWQSINYGDH